MRLDSASVEAAASVMPIIPELAKFIKGASKLTTVPDHIPGEKARFIWVPVLCIRWACADPEADASDAYMGAYTLVEDLLCGRQKPEEVAPIEVALENGRLWALSGQRLAALKMYQVLRCAEVVRVRCVIRNEDTPHFNRPQACRQRGWGLNLCSLSTSRSALGSPLTNPISQICTPMSQTSTATPLSHWPVSTVSTPSVPPLKLQSELPSTLKSPYELHLTSQSGLTTPNPSGTHLRPVTPQSAQATVLMQQFKSGPLSLEAVQNPVRSSSARRKRSSNSSHPCEKECIDAIAQARSEGETREALSDAVLLFRSPRVGVRENFAAMGGVEAVVAALKRLPQSCGVQQVGCQILELAASMWRESSEVRCLHLRLSFGADIIAAGGVDALTSAMVTHRGDPEVQMKVCAALAELAEGASTEWAESGCTEQLTKCLKTQCSGDAMLQCNMCKIIPRSVASPAGRAKLVECGCIAELLAAASSHPNDVEVQRAICTGLSHMANASDDCHTSVVEQGGVTTSAAALCNCLSDRHAVSSACVALHDIIKADPQAALQAGENTSAVEGVVQGLRKHWGDADVARNACDALVSLCVHPSNRKRASEAGAIEIVTATLGFYGAADARVRRSATSALSALTTGDALKRRQMMEALKFAKVVPPDELL